MKGGNLNGLSRLGHGLGRLHHFAKTLLRLGTGSVLSVKKVAKAAIRGENKVRDYCLTGAITDLMITATRVDLPLTNFFSCCVVADF